MRFVYQIRGSWARSSCLAPTGVRRVPWPHAAARLPQEGGDASWSAFSRSDEVALRARAGARHLGRDRRRGGSRGGGRAAHEGVLRRRARPHRLLLRRLQQRLADAAAPRLRVGATNEEDNFSGKFGMENDPRSRIQGEAHGATPGQAKQIREFSSGGLAGVWAGDPVRAARAGVASASPGSGRSRDRW